MSGRSDRVTTKTVHENLTWTGAGVDDLLLFSNVRRALIVAVNIPLLLFAFGALPAADRPISVDSAVDFGITLTRL